MLFHDTLKLWQPVFSAGTSCGVTNILQNHFNDREMNAARWQWVCSNMRLRLCNFAPPWTAAQKKVRQTQCFSCFYLKSFVSFSLSKAERLSCRILYFFCFFLNINKVLWTENPPPETLWHPKAQQEMTRVDFTVLSHSVEHRRPGAKNK